MIAKKLLLGIDLGTMLIKAILFTTNGEEVCSAEKEVEVEYPYPGWAEQDPEYIWNSTVEVLRKLIKTHNINAHQIVGVSLTGQMHGTFLVDNKGKPVRRKAIIWLDTRSKQILDELYKKGLADKIYDISCWKPITSMQLMHLIWLKRNEPDILNKTSHLLTCKDYIRMRITGNAATDITDASVTGIMDTSKLRWSEDICQEFGIPMKILPEILKPWDLAGYVTKEAEKETGLLEGTPVAVGAGDICATALGAGAIDTGQLTAIIGTAGIYELAVDKLIPDNERRYSIACHAVPGMWLLEAVQMTAGASLRWFKDVFCKEELMEAEKSGVSVYSIIDKKAMEIPPGAHGVIFHPFLQGERSPFVNPNARGMFFGLRLNTKKGDIIKAVLEGVAFSALDNIELFRKKGLNIKEVRMVGGGAKSIIWPQIFADVLNVPISITKIKDCGALGAAIEASIVAGIFKRIDEAVKRMVIIEREIQPRPKYVKIYEELFHVYREIYKNIWNIWDKIDNIQTKLMEVF
ncbi:MAG: xylulokinase [Candidatus Methanomethylicaceae archaeon]